MARCKPTFNIDEEIIDGGWSSWGKWICSKNCDSGDGVRVRMCTNPPPSHFGRPCHGPYVFKGKCNTHECGDLTEETKRIIVYVISS